MVVVCGAVQTRFPRTNALPTPSQLSNNTRGHSITNKKKLVVAIDQRGYSDSDKPSGVAPYRLERLAADVADAVKALGHDRVGVLVAHDWGGNVAWTVAGTHGSRLIDRLVVIALPHFGVGVTNIDGAQRAKSSYVLQFQAPGLPEATLTAGGAEAAEKFFTEPPVVRGAVVLCCVSAVLLCDVCC